MRLPTLHDFDKDSIKDREERKSRLESKEAKKQKELEEKRKRREQQEKIDPGTVRPWTEKYCPLTLSEVAGHDKPLTELKLWIEQFPNSKIKAAMVHGPTGNGKTSSIYALANDLDFEILEMNASDKRTAAAIEETMGNAAKQSSLLEKKGKIILVDEIDGVHGNSDRGGIKAIERIIKESRFPIILTANDPWKTNLKNLKKSCKDIKLSKVNVRSVGKRLKEISEKEGIQANEETIAELSHLSDGDLRVAITDLQTLSNGNSKIEKKDLKVLGYRRKEVKIYDTLLAILKTKDIEHIQRSVWDTGNTPDEILLWVAENVAKEYDDPEELAKAYDAISRANVFRGRIIHNQAWGLLAFSQELATIGVALAKKDKYNKFAKYGPPGILMKMGRSKFKRAARDSIAKKLGEQLHCSKKDAISQFPYLGMISRSNNFNFGLEQDEIEFVQNF